LSGIDYDDSAKVAYIVSDSHKGEVRQPVRFYTAAFQVSRDSLFGVHLTNTVLIKHHRAQGSVDTMVYGAEPEAIRMLQSHRTLIWSTEKESDGAFVWTMDADGKQQQEIPYRPVLANPQDSNQSEPLTFVDGADKTAEGLALSPDRRKVWIAPEEGFIEDTSQVPLAMRITRVDLRSRQADYEFAYVLHGPIQPAYKNGISEILGTDNPYELFVLERAFNEKERKVYAGVYRVTLKKGNNILGKKVSSGALVKSTLLLNLTDYFDRHAFAGMASLDNVEGMTWGPTLSDGSRTLVFITDNNFSSRQQTQVFAFKFPLTQSGPQRF
jgi:hypothetical protein